MKNRFAVAVTCAVLLSLKLCQSVPAAITWTGNIDPSNPTTWTSSTTGYIGKTADGTITVDGDSDLLSLHGNVGSGSGSTGHVTVDGPGSTWTNSLGLYVGDSGFGTLSITGGGAVSNSSGYVGYGSGSTGQVTVDGVGSTWTNSSGLTVGYFSAGTLSITGGGAVVSNSSGVFVGYGSGSTGQVTVDGVGSTWTNGHVLYVGTLGGAGTLSITDDGTVSVNGHLIVGKAGTGTLSITGGGAVSVSGDTEVVSDAGSSGEVHFAGGTLTTGGLVAAVEDLTGSGTIQTHGLVMDVDLVFDATHGLNQTLTLNELPGQDITLQLSVNGSGSIGAGHAGAGTMTIADGVTVASTYGSVGYGSGSTGQVTVDGVGSTWTNSLDLYVGDAGAGTLSITGGGAVVSNSSGFVGGRSGSTGQVTVDGVGSIWTNSSGLYVGFGGVGRLSITGGAAVSNSSGYVGSGSGLTGQVTVDGVGSTWTNGRVLIVGRAGAGTLSITGGAIVSVAGTLYVDQLEDGDSFVNMATGGVLALAADTHQSIAQFLGSVGGTKAIRYWDDSVGDWADILQATYGVDYTLAYLTTGNLAGYTLLTVGTYPAVPEPASSIMLLFSAAGFCLRRGRAAG